MNFAFQVGGLGSPLEGPNSGHYHQTYVPSPRPNRRSTVSATEVYNRLSIQGNMGGSSKSSINDINMVDFGKTNSNRHGYPSRKSSAVEERISLGNSTRVNKNDLPLTTRLLKDEERASAYGQSVLEDLPIHHDCQSSGCERVIINVSGLKFETQIRTLERLPRTLLGDPDRRKRFWSKEKNEFFFDRHRPSFQAILYYYQSGGRLKRPLEVPMDIFLNELAFYDIPSSAVNTFKEKEGCIVEPTVLLIPKVAWKRRLWEVMEFPESSVCARVFAFFSITFILLSIVTFCVETLPELKNSGCVNKTVINKNGTKIEVSVHNWFDSLFLIESVCILFFVLELIGRFIVCPSKIMFLKSSINWIDLISILPYFIFLALSLGSTSCGGSHKGSFLSVLRVIRVVRILKLSKHSQGLKILGKTMKTSIRELSMFILFLGIATVIYAGGIFYAEEGQEKTMFVSIPDAFWWAIVTMTTVGYGDYVPVGPLGKLLGGFCVLSGVLAIALPVPVIVANFNNYYRHYTASLKERKKMQKERANLEHFEKSAEEDEICSTSTQ